jgi:glycosyltransferase involved in cell wall biosynthesis
MRILAVLHSPVGSGGDTTIRRIAGHLVESGHSVVPLPDPGDAGLLRQAVARHGVEAMIGTHAYLSGQLFLGSDLPYVIVFGGTDLNDFVLDPDAMALMTAAVDEAAALVAFNDDFVRRCQDLWPRAAAKLWHIPQGVNTEPAPDFSLRRRLGLSTEDILLLLPSGLRPVKDPLMLIRTVARWHAEDPRVHMVISGLSYDDDFQGIVTRRCAASPGVDYIGALPRPQLQAAMREATAVLNTSLSECSPNALLEAMRLRCCVLVRDIPGNTCVVRHNETGLVFSDPDDFRVQAQRLVDDARLRVTLGRRAGRYARWRHGLQPERAAYARLFQAVEERSRLVEVGQLDAYAPAGSHDG